MAADGGTVIGPRFTAEQVAAIDADAERRGKTRTAWLHDLAVAMLDGRLVMAPARRTTPVAASTRPRREYSKADQASGRGGRPA